MLTVNLHRLSHASADAATTDKGPYVSVKLCCGMLEQVTLFFGSMTEIIAFHDAAEEALRLAKVEGLPNVRID